MDSRPRKRKYIYKPATCDICMKTFAKRSKLNVHINNIHSLKEIITNSSIYTSLTYIAALKTLFMSMNQITDNL